MNILLLGNGFDLAHGLPTKYTDFLFFCSVIKTMIKDNELEEKIPEDKENLNKWLESDENISFSIIKENDTYVKIFKIKRGQVGIKDNRVYREMLDNFIKKEINQRKVKEILYLVVNNNWLEYFISCYKYGNKSWIDFESEISRVIRVLEIVNKKIGESNLFNIKDNLIFKVLKYISPLKKKYVDRKVKRTIKTIGMRLKSTDVYSKISNYGEIIYFFKVEEKLKSIILDDNIKSRYEDEFYRLVESELKSDYEYNLNKLIRIFEIYLCEYVMKIDNHIFSPDIRNADVERIISFNYTDTYERLYERRKNIEYDYIHGKADINNTIETNNMVLGIDEYLPDDRRNKDLEFIAFKKFYQRIHKETGCKYKDWISEIEKINKIYEEKKRNIEIFLKDETGLGSEVKKKRKKLDELNENPPKHNLYIFGHSLDVTDKDILRDLILNDNLYTTIFYHDKNTMGQQIANLVKVIGQDELIRRTGGCEQMIKFKQQKPMIPMEDIR